MDLDTLPLFKNIVLSYTAIYNLEKFAKSKETFTSYSHLSQQGQYVKKVLCQIPYSYLNSVNIALKISITSLFINILYIFIWQIYRLWRKLSDFYTKLATFDINTFLFL